jgi:hypothetical protein
MKTPRDIGKSFLYHFGGKLPDALYLWLMYFFQTGKRLHLKHPKTFNEKLQWLKLHDRKPEYTTMVDKYAVKEYVANIIGKEYIVPTLGVWDSPDEIAWDDLPRQFVLKTTHGGGSKGIVICRDKETLDKTAAISNLHAAMKRDLYKNYREWPYKDVKHRVIAEEYLSGEDEERGIKDYKFFCFNDKPMYCDVISGRWGNLTSDHFDMEWNHLSFTFKSLPMAESVPAKPKNFDTMRKLAAQLSAGHSHLRVDFYEVNGKVYFGELTFYSASGFGQFNPDEWDKIWGEHIRIEHCNVIK